MPHASAASLTQRGAWRGVSGGKQLSPMPRVSATHAQWYARPTGRPFDAPGPIFATNGGGRPQTRRKVR